MTITEELDSVRKTSSEDMSKIPIAGKTSVWKDTMLSRIHEGLRRKDDKEDSSKKRPEEEKTSVITPFTSMHF